MTTEVLRNMMYAGSSTLLGLGFVVMDEVHYLADRFRGAVWEEVIIGLPESVQVIALSATVSNAEEFGDWLAEVRGAMEIVVSERRPVPLFQHVLVGSQLYDLYAGVAPTAAVDGSPAPKADVNPALLRIARDESRWVRDDSRRPRGRSGKGQRRVSYGSGSFGGASKNLGAPADPTAADPTVVDRAADRAGRRDRPVAGTIRRQSRPDAGRSDGGGYRPRSMAGPSRADMVKTLDDAALLPAIVFIFSRVGCDAAVSQLLGSGIVLTSKTERSEIGDILRRHRVQPERGGPAGAALRLVRRGDCREASRPTTPGCCPRSRSASRRRSSAAW